MCVCVCVCVCVCMCVCVCIHIHAYCQRIYIVCIARGPLSTVYSDGEISTCGQIIEVHSVQSTMMGRSQQVGKL